LTENRTLRAVKRMGLQGHGRSLEAAELTQMISLLRSIWIWTASAALILFWAPLVGMVRLFDREPLRLRTGRWFRRLGRVLAKVNPWRIQISGCENLNANQVYVIVCNHQSLADIPVIAHLKLDTKWLAKAELFQLPVVGWMLRMAGDVPIERSDRRNSAKALSLFGSFLPRRHAVTRRARPAVQRRSIPPGHS
jgi:1-acyl-sn-glycerol-3-phosphate acyltransferase